MMRALISASVGDFPGKVWGGDGGGSLTIGGYSYDYSSGQVRGWEKEGIPCRPPSSGSF
jgi:hypothetical protein